MIGKTPKFSAKITELLEKLVPHESACITCKRNWQITHEDIEIYKKFEVSPPTECFPCRRRRRLAFCNYTTLYKVTSDAPGHETGSVIGSIPKPARFPIYDYDSYWATDLIKYGRDYDPAQSFTEQFDALFCSVPQVATSRDPSNVNSDYTLYGANFKNCYYLLGGGNNENVMFSMWPFMSRDSSDLLTAMSADNCYEGVFPERCFNCFYTYYAKDCLGSWFLYDCRNCSNCFGCVNLRNKQYCWFNEELSKEEYEARVKPIIQSGSYKTISEYKEKFFAFVKSQPIRATRSEHSENYSGNHVIHSKNCFDCFWTVQCEGCRGVDFVMKVRDSVDMCITDTAERVYYAALVGAGSYNVKFSIFSRGSIDAEYLMNCRNCSNCFGCIGLQNKKFCIFNKQYSEGEYWKLLDEIKSAMLERGEYGQFFLYAQSPYPYNASLSQIMYPLTEPETRELGAWWHPEEDANKSNITLTPLTEMPDKIVDVPDSITERAFKDSFGRLFRITRVELDFYRRKNLPLPRLAPKSRFMERFGHVNNFQTGPERCAKCNKEVESSYFAKDGYKVYCEQCFQQEIA